MADLENAVEKVFYDRLVALVTLAKVYEHVPQDATAPLAMIASVTSVPIGGKAGQLEQFTVNIATETRGGERKPLNALKAQVAAALDEWRPAAGTVAQFGQVRLVSNDPGAQSPDGLTYYGSQTFSVIAQPA